MGKVYCEISMSLDGFITGPNVRVGNGLGDGGECLHDWMFDAKTDTDARIVDERYVTHEARESLPMQGGTTYTFVTDGIEAALELARAAASDKNVGIWGGANIIRQYLKAGLLDEMQIDIIPILLGDGIRLFEGLDPQGIELRKTSAIDTPGATHFRFQVHHE